MDMMEVRRRVMLSMAQGKYLWKTVTLEEDHTKDANGTLAYWCNTFFNIFNQPDYSEHIWLCVFMNNDASSYAADVIVTTKDINGNNKQTSARSGWTDVNTSYARSLYASAGTAIKIYKIPK